MSKRAALIPSVQLNVALPLDVHTRLTAHLYSEFEGRVPQGGYQALLTDLIRNYFSHKHLDLAPFAGSDSGAFVVSGAPEAIAKLEQILKGVYVL